MEPRNNKSRNTATASAVTPLQDGWRLLTRDSTPAADRLVAVVFDGRPLCGTTYLSDEFEDAGLWIDCGDAGIWNVDLDERERLPSHFVELPQLPNVQDQPT